MQPKLTQIEMKMCVYYILMRIVQWLLFTWRRKELLSHTLYHWFQLKITHIHVKAFWQGENCIISFRHLVVCVNPGAKRHNAAVEMATMVITQIRVQIAFLKTTTDV